MNLWHSDGKPSHVLEFQLDEHSNTPTVVNVSCTAEEQEMIGPYPTSPCRPQLAHEDFTKLIFI
jgi:hypothetical protein